MTRFAEEIFIRPFDLDDAEALLTWASSADQLLQWAGPHFSFPLDASQLAKYADTRGEHRHLLSAVTTTGVIVGHVELIVLPEHELGQIRKVAVAPYMRGQGIAGILLGWLIEFAFDELGLHRLELVVFSFDEPALRCYERLSFIEEGRARHARKASEGYWDLIYMALLEHERSETGSQAHARIQPRAR